MRLVEGGGGLKQYKKSILIGSPVYTSEEVPVECGYFDEGRIHQGHACKRKYEYQDGILDLQGAGQSKTDFDVRNPLVRAIAA